MVLCECKEAKLPGKNRIPSLVTLIPGTGLNYGVHEDSDPLRVITPTQVLIIGPEENGALPICIIENGKPSDEVLYWHQQEHTRKIY
jgi:hypothetical protein